MQFQFQNGHLQSIPEDIQPGGGTARETRRACARHLHYLRQVEGGGAFDPAPRQLKRKLMSCSHCQELGQLADLQLLIGCSLLCSQSGASLLVDTTLDNATTTHKFPSLHFQWSTKAAAQDF